MSNLRIDIFAEDIAHEAFLGGLVMRLVRERKTTAILNRRSARGGHGRALEELKKYQQMTRNGVIALPDILIVGIDANCRSFGRMHREIEDQISDEFKDRVAIACPDPHIERWFLADLESFHRVIGVYPRMRQKKCERDYYKEILNTAIINAGYVASLGGIEFAREIVEAMDLYQAGKSENSLRHFLDDVNSRLVSVVRATAK